MNYRLGLSVFGLCGTLIACQAANKNNSASAAKPAAKAAPAAAGAGLSDSTVVAKWTGGELTYGQLRAERKAAIAKLEQERHQKLSREIEGLVMDRLLKAAAKKAGAADEKAYTKMLQDKVTKEAVNKFYEERVKRSGQPLEQVEPRIREYLAMTQEIERIRKDAKIDITLPEPEVPVQSFEGLADRPVKGAKDAKVTIVEFSDFECPYCSRANEPLKKLMETFPGQIKIHFLHFPLSFHKKAMPAAIAARCAQQQGKFWEMHDKIFENQRTLSDESNAAFAKELGLDAAKYDACIKDPASKAFVEADMKMGTEAGVGGTPSFFVNGRQVQGVPTEAAIRKALGKS